MAVPKQRQTSSRTRRRKRHNEAKQTPVNLVECKEKGCNAKTLPHRVCDACGMYAGVQHKEVVTKAG